MNLIAQYWWIWLIITAISYIASQISDEDDLAIFDYQSGVTKIVWFISTPIYQIGLYFSIFAILLRIIQFIKQ